MSVRTAKTIASGISLLANGKYRVRATVGKTGSGGITHEKIFDVDATLPQMKLWRKTEYLRIRSEHPVVQTKGTFAADLLRYLRIIQNRLEFPRKRAVEIKAWMPRFAARRRHTITKDEV